MKYENKHNLPTWLIDKLNPRTKPPNPKRMSITDLIHPPRMRTLQIEKWDELVTDYSDLLNFFDGNNLDAAFADEENSQKKMEIEKEGVTLVGVLDMFIETPDGVIIIDTKRAKVGVKAYDTVREWERQLNCYAFMYTTLTGKAVVGLENHIFYKDWSPVKASYGDYPACSYEVYHQPVWKTEDVDKYITDRLKYHREQPNDCHIEERWGSFAVMSNGRQRANRVLKTEQECLDWMEANKKGDYIENRDCLRCKHFCSVKSVCPDVKENTNGSQ